MKVAILVSIARQVEGEFCFVRVVKANTNADKLHRFLRQNTLPQTTVLGDVDCVLEYGVIEDIEVEDGDAPTLPPA
jgi:hypothetical protein